MERLSLKPKARGILQSSSKLDATCTCYFRFWTVISCHWLLQFFQSYILLNSLPLPTFPVLGSCSFDSLTVARLLVQLSYRLIFVQFVVTELLAYNPADF